MNIFHSLLNFLQDFWNILEEFVEHMNPQSIQDDTNDNTDEYSQEFSTEQLCRITKLAGLSTNMQIFPGKPLLFKSNVGSLGKISIFIKSKEQLENETCLVESEYESDD